MKKGKKKKEKNPSCFFFFANQQHISTMGHGFLLSGFEIAYRVSPRREEGRFFGIPHTPPPHHYHQRTHACSWYFLTK